MSLVLCVSAHRTRLALKGYVPNRLEIGGGMSAPKSFYHAHLPEHTLNNMIVEL